MCYLFFLIQDLLWSWYKKSELIQVLNPVLHDIALLFTFVASGKVADFFVFYSFFPSLYLYLILSV